ncbi:MAG: zinc ribbon domain-containing protein [Kiritimatiellia bacterium]|jgi:putative FmdB family regulatory protein|nr:zinc ribbon domain-containing protein [Kiritimatiellia bacterium]MDP6630833.1 zinc ribbon domain-containing protein [Kiritimatiellia bacterium]MDP6811288.1 zinc ribbon domain-containing protein [Kiritimatiellia bacterium]MDP7024098.1 zinc ribbon domain-containing protein [Kiritimatiellia bacterium]
MPTYEYECRKCGHAFEKFQSMTEERIRTCPECKGRVDRLIGTGAGIIFKGSGFYETDYRSDSYQKAAQKASSSSPATSSDTRKKDPAKKDGASGSASTDKKPGKPKKKASDT